MTRPCPTCGRPLFSTAAIDPVRPRRLWRCTSLHAVWLDDVAPPAPAEVPAPSPGQMELL